MQAQGKTESDASTDDTVTGENDKQRQMNLNTEALGSQYCQTTAMLIV